MQSKFPCLLLTLTLSSSAWACLDDLWIPGVSTINLGQVQVGSVTRFVVTGMQTNYDGSGFPVVLMPVATGPLMINGFSAQSPFVGNGGSDPITIMATPTASGAQNATITFNFRCGSFPLANPRSVMVNFNGLAAVAPLQITTDSPLPSGTAGQSYGPVPFAASGGTGPYRNWRITQGTAPGLTLNPSTGILAGSPPAAGTFNFTVAVDDGSSPTMTASKIFSLTVKAAPLQITTAPGLTDTVAGQTYTLDLSGSGGAGGFTNWMFMGISPPGLQIDSNTGRITGTVNSPGQFIFTVQMEDRSKATTCKQFALFAADPNQPGVKAFLPTQLADGVNNGDSSEMADNNPLSTEIAAGPSDILTIVNRTIARYPNPNAPGGPGFLPSALQPRVGLPNEKIALDAWMGPDVTKSLCPTEPRTQLSCVIGNATVQYDQLQGRFIVLFTATDTGLTDALAQPVLTSVNKASWVLAVSRYASFFPGTPVFSKPTPGGTSPSDTTNWFVWYGPDQGFGGGIGTPDAGNINALPGIPGSAGSFGCTALATPGMACYFPTGARLGVDNDNIILTAPVLDVDFIGGYAGTRVRAIKKSALYTGAVLVPGNQFASTPEDASKGDYYDLFTADGSGAPVSGFTVANPQNPAAALFFEPAHLRGRALTSYVNFPSGGVSYLLGAVSSDQPQQNLFLQPIVFSRTGTDPSAYFPTLGNLETIRVPDFSNPVGVPQAGQNSPFLYVGDNRPQTVIFREGQLYDARTIGTNFACSPSGTGVLTTVGYDIIQKFLPTAPATLVFNSKWPNTNAFAPMFDVPANVISSGSASPINIFPWLEKLFVGTTFPALSNTDPRNQRLPAPNGDPRYQYSDTGAVITGLDGQDPCSAPSSTQAYPGLWDIRCGEDTYSTVQAYRNPVTGSSFNAVPFGIRGGASTDVNNMGLWSYGAYAKRRLASQPGIGQWGTYVAHYPLTFPIRDPYNNLNNFYTDVPPGNPFFPFVQIAKQTEIDPGSRTATTFNPSGTVLRRDMAKWIVRAQADEAAITSYLNSTGGIFCSFADVECPGRAGDIVANTTGTTEWRYIETMYRRGYTKGCGGADDVTRMYCPNDTVTRGEMAVFLIRAKMSNVFPTTLNGCPAGLPVCGRGTDNFGLFVPSTPYFTDVQPTDPSFLYVQKMFELRISNGTTVPTFSSDTNSYTGGMYSPDQSLTRAELMTFLVHAFFP